MLVKVVQNPLHVQNPTLHLTTLPPSCQPLLFRTVTPSMPSGDAGRHLPSHWPYSTGLDAGALWFLPEGTTTWATWSHLFTRAAGGGGGLLSETALPPATRVAKAMRHLTLKMAKYEPPRFVDSMKFCSSAFFWMTACNSSDHKSIHEKECLRRKAYSAATCWWSPAVFRHEYTKWWEQGSVYSRVKEFALENVTRSSHTPQNQAQALTLQLP